MSGDQERRGDRKHPVEETAQSEHAKAGSETGHTWQPGGYGGPVPDRGKEPASGGSAGKAPGGAAPAGGATKGGKP